LRDVLDVAVVVVGGIKEKVLIEIICCCHQIIVSDMRNGRKAKRNKLRLFYCTTIDCFEPLNRRESSEQQNNPTLCLM